MQHSCVQFRRGARAPKKRKFFLFFCGSYFCKGHAAEKNFLLGFFYLWFFHTLHQEVIVFAKKKDWHGITTCLAGAPRNVCHMMPASVLLCTSFILSSNPMIRARHMTKSGREKPCPPPPSGHTRPLCKPSAVPMHLVPINSNAFSWQCSEANTCVGRWLRSKRRFFGDTAVPFDGIISSINFWGDGWHCEP